jgi:hypothetical protein
MAAVTGGEFVLSEGAKIAIAAGAGVALGVGGTIGIQALCAAYSCDDEPAPRNRTSKKRPSRAKK